MKLFIVTCLKEYQNDVSKIFKEAKINVFSATSVIGFNDSQSPNLLEEWFAAGDERFDSIIIFSFTGNEKAENGIELVKKYNNQHERNFPVRAFVVPIEKSSY